MKKVGEEQANPIFGTHPQRLRPSSCLERGVWVYVDKSQVKSISAGCHPKYRISWSKTRSPCLAMLGIQKAQRTFSNVGPQSLPLLFSKSIPIPGLCTSHLPTSIELLYRSPFPTCNRWALRCRDSAPIGQVSPLWHPCSKDLFERQLPLRPACLRIQKRVRSLVVCP